MIEAVLERLRPMFPAIAFATDMTDDGTVYGCLFTKGGRGPQCCYTVECPDGASVTAFTVRDVADDDKLIGVASSMFQACDLVLEVTMGSFTTRTAH